MENAFRAAVQNIARHGDTDVFPFPIENHVFFDKTEAVVALLQDIHKNLNQAIADYPPVAEGMLATVGYTGFRWATQIDPLWNAYFLALVISAGQSIEDARLPISRGNVFSYRFKWNEEEKTIFDKTLGWVQFQQESVKRARNAKYVLVCDISDFYPRIYHHRLENALQKATGNLDICSRIMKLLMQFSNNVSYGLPVGGPAARLLSELLLNRVDRLLVTNGINFCRFADDYHVFAESAEQAYRYLVFISEKLQANEGLLLQKAKTRVMSVDEFLATSEFAEENEAEGEEESISRNFLRLRLHFDPYSQTAEKDYELLKDEIVKFDIVGMLGREMRKSRVHQSLARKLIGALRLLESAQRDSAIISLMENLTVLYPVYPSIMLLLKGVILEMNEDSAKRIFRRLRELITAESYIVQVPTHLAFSVRVLAQDKSEEADEVLAGIYEKTRSSAVRRDVILAMAKKNADFWVSDIRKNFKTVTEWERTALLIGSFILGDEGEHWRKSIKNALTPMQKLVLEWASEREKSGNKEVPV
ncbi:RNA-directed DNA polymerase [Undibacterium sp. TJN25]|uniref:RNA-directed DNA polymerase n=1 Tax=Undibacterium sp. TJN25 TaxID=3413056 RepID=UPI003BF09BF7